MKFLRHKEVDKQKWDTLLSRSFKPSLYMQSWYLDAACPNWNAIVWGDYEAVHPLPTKRWCFVQRIFQPYFVQQTGIAFTVGFDLQNALSQLFQSQLFKRFFSVRIHFQSELNLEIQKVLDKKWQFEYRKNYLLSLDAEYSQLSKGYNENRKRNLKKAKASGWQVVPTDDIAAAILMYKQNQATKQKDLSTEVYQVLERIFHACESRTKGELLSCLNKEGEPISYAYFVYDSGRIYYLFGTMNAEGREKSAVSLLFDHVIFRNAEKPLCLDFEGGNVKNIETYFLSFGAVEEKYLAVWK